MHIGVGDKDNAALGENHRHADGTLSRLDVAFSRDQARKDYVQHRMAENAGDLWRWLQDGAHFYICGDAKRMAADVEKALVAVIATEGGMEELAAKAYVAQMKKDARYQADVY